MAKGGVSGLYTDITGHHYLQFLYVYGRHLFSLLMADLWVLCITFLFFNVKGCSHIAVTTKKVIMLRIVSKQRLCTCNLPMIGGGHEIINCRILSPSFCISISVM